MRVLVPQFDYPGHGYATTSAVGVSNNGAVAGWVFDPSGAAVLFERLPGSGYTATAGFPGASVTYARGVNSSNLICGQILGADAQVHGFFYDQPTGTFTQYDVPGRLGTTLAGLNDAGDFCGYTVSSGFVSIGGSLVEFTVPGAQYIYPSAVNNLGQVVGTYRLERSNQFHGFFRDADGTLTYPLDYPDAVFTDINGLNDNGLMAGNYTLHGDSIAHGFVRQADGRTISFDVAGAVYGVGVSDINNSGLMTGAYLGSSDSQVHSFLARFVP